MCAFCRIKISIFFSRKVVISRASLDCCEVAEGILLLGACYFDTRCWIVLWFFVRRIDVWYGL